MKRMTAMMIITTATNKTIGTMNSGILGKGSIKKEKSVEFSTL